MSRNLTIIFIIIAVSTIAFFFGYRYGYRDNYNEANPNIEYTQKIFGNDNILNQIRIQAINGPYPGSSDTDFSRGYIILNKNSDKTDLKIVLKNIPSTVVINEDKKNNIPLQKIEFPKSLRIEAAFLNATDKSLNFIHIADMSLNPPEKNQYSGEFSVTIENKTARLDEAKFLYFYDNQTLNQNLYEISFKDFPNLDEDKKRPFLWSKL